MWQGVIPEFLPRNAAHRENLLSMSRKKMVSSKKCHSFQPFARKLNKGLAAQQFHASRAFAMLPSLDLYGAPRGTANVAPGRVIRQMTRSGLIGIYVLRRCWSSVRVADHRPNRPR